jgi:hypothetical protein
LVCKGYLDEKVKIASKLEEEPKEEDGDAIKGQDIKRH